MEVFYVIWHSYDEKTKQVVGFLIYDNKWYFKYNSNCIKKAMDKGFRPFPDMLDINKMYESKDLFQVFKNRYYNFSIELMKKDYGKLLTDKILIKYERER